MTDHAPLMSAAFDARSHDAQARAMYGAFVPAIDALNTLAIKLHEGGHELAAGTVEWLGKELDGVGSFVVGGGGQ